MEELLFDRIRMKISDAQFRVSTDSMVLADFCRIRPGSRVLDLGCGCGTLGLLLLGADGTLHVSGIEIQEAAACQAQENAEENGFSDHLHIVCGDLQPLGIHMNYGGSQSGFMATMDDPTYVLEFPSRLFGICRTNTEGEYAFADVAYDRTSFGHLRDKAKEYVGTQTALWGITAGVYLATMGPEGMKEVGETIMQNAQYAASKLAALPNVSLRFETPFFKEFVLDFNKTGKTVKEINKALLEKHIFGGKDLSGDFPALGQCAMYCVTEVHTKEDIDTLVSALSEILG